MNSTEPGRGLARRVATKAGGRVLLWLAIAGAALCAWFLLRRDPPPLRAGVVHLDLRLADGTSPSAQLAALPTKWNARWELNEDANALSPWTIRLADVLAKDGSAGIRLRGNALEATRVRGARVELRYAPEFAASDFNHVEVELSEFGGTQAQLRWKSSVVAPNSYGWSADRTVYIDVKDGRGTARFALDDEPAWRGTISELTLLPMHQGVQNFRLHGLRIGTRPFAWGTEPGGAASGDAGLIALGCDARRSWPSDWNVPLHAQVAIPRGASLEVDVALAGQAPADVDDLRFVIETRVAAGAWELLAERTEPARELERAWRHWSIDLAPWADSKRELRFRAGPSAAAHADGISQRARVYWASPEIVVRTPRVTRANLIVITLDTTRADAIGALAAAGGGLPANRTPALDRLAAEGLLFTNAWSACNSTSPAHASLFTGLAVREHGLINNLSRLADEQVTLAERLRDAGYHTAAAVSVRHLQAGYSGLGQGFDQFELAHPGALQDGSSTLAPVLAWLADWRASGERPFFLWLHFFDAHQYAPPDAFLREHAARIGLEIPPQRVDPPTIPASLSERHDWYFGEVNNAEYLRFVYRAAVAYVDSLVARLREALERERLLERCVVLVVADHGESLGEQDSWANHDLLHPAVMQVPLILRLPAEMPGGARGNSHGRRIDELVSILDLQPTLLELLGVDAPRSARGRSLLECIDGATWPERRVWFECHDLDQLGCRDREVYAISTLKDTPSQRSGRSFEAGDFELYECARDVDWFQAAASENKSLAARYRDFCERWLAGTHSTATLERELGPEDREQLRRLGYLAD